jgi:hypothetical protein
MDSTTPVGHPLTPWKSEESAPVKKQPFRRMSFFKPITNPAEEPVIKAPILTTHHINKEYDPETGNKIINNYMILNEIGRGVHGKVKLAEDLDTGELVVMIILKKKNVSQLILKHYIGN